MFAAGKSVAQMNQQAHTCPCAVNSGWGPRPGGHVRLRHLWSGAAEDNGSELNVCPCSRLMCDGSDGLNGGLHVPRLWQEGSPPCFSMSMGLNMFAIHFWGKIAHDCKCQHLFQKTHRSLKPLTLRSAGHPIRVTGTRLLKRGRAAD